MKTLPKFIMLALFACFIIPVIVVYFSIDIKEQNISEKSDGKKYFRMNLGTEPPTLDPVEASDLVSITVLMNIMRGLTEYGSNQQVQPAFAKTWDKSPDGKKYVFHLRDNAYWSDGKPVTAHDFIYAWQRVLDPANGSPYAFLLFDIENARAFYNGKIKNPSNLGFKALDDRTLEVKLERPVAYFLQIMAFSISLPMRKDIVDKYNRTFTEAGHYITNGPYKLDKWEHENLIVLTPNQYYWKGAPLNDGIKMFMIPEPNTSLIMYENNELDFIETTSSLPTKEVRRLKNRSDFNSGKLHAISYLGFNTQKKPFDDARVRKAFIHAFDRTFIPKLFQGGEQPINSWISPGIFAYNPRIGLGFDVKQARQYLAEAGYPEGKNFPPVELMYASTTPENRQLAEIAQFQWQQNLGVKIDIRNVEWKVFLKQLDEDPPAIFRLQWFVDYPDPDSFMGVFISESGNNHTRWTSAVYDQRVRNASVTFNPEKRLALYNLVQKELLEEVAAIMPLYVVPKSYMLKSHVKGFHLDELNIALLDKVRIKEK